MIGIKASRRKAGKEEAEKPFWISFSDLMTALMVLFLVAMAVALIAVTHGLATISKDKEERDTIMQEFENRAGDVHIVVQDGTIREGYDLPYISVVGILRNAGAVSLFGQFVGRGVRKLVQSFVGEGVPISPSDNVCHIVTHNW